MLLALSGNQRLGAKSLTSPFFGRIPLLILLKPLFADIRPLFQGNKSVGQTMPRCLPGIQLQLLFDFAAQADLTSLARPSLPAFLLLLFFFFFFY